MRRAVHTLAETRELVIHAPARAILIAERTVLGQAVPRIDL